MKEGARRVYIAGWAAALVEARDWASCLGVGDVRWVKVGAEDGR